MGEFRLHIWQGKTSFVCILLFAGARFAALGDDIEELSKTDVQDPLGGTIQTPDLVPNGYDEEGLSLDGAISNQRTHIKKISKRSAYDFKVPTPHRRYFDTLGKGNYPTRPHDGYDWDSLYDPALYWGEAKRNQNGDASWDYPIEGTWGHSGYPVNDPYMESVYMPYHFLGAYKRSSPPRYLKDRTYPRRAPLGKGVRGLHERNLSTNLEELTPVKRRKRSTEQKSGQETYKMSSSDSYAIDSSQNGFSSEKPPQYSQAFRDGSMATDWTPISMRKRLSESNRITGYHGNYENDASNLHGDNLRNEREDFYPLKGKSEEKSSGFHSNSSMKGRKAGISTLGRNKRGNLKQLSEITFKRFHSNNV